MHRPLLVLVLPLFLAAAALAHDGVTDPGVRKRMDNMIAGKQAIDRLGAMVGGRMLFDRDQARRAREVLLITTAATPRLFRRPHTDLLTRARPGIWTDWRDFRSRAQAAGKAARRLDTRSLNRLRKTLPALLVACLQCHEVYRAPHPAHR